MDITNILVSAFQNHIKMCSRQIRLDGESYELATCFLRAELGEQRLHTAKRSQRRAAHKQHLLFCAVHLSGLWVVGHGGKEVSIRGSSWRAPQLYLQGGDGFILLLLFFKLLATLCSMWDLSSPTRDQTHAPAVEAWRLNHWTAREVPGVMMALDVGICP